MSLPNRDRLHQLLDDLHLELEKDESTNLVTLVRKAARLAHIANQPEYATLFELHLEGFARGKGGAVRITKWSDPDAPPLWDPVEAVFQDRSESGDKVQGLSLEEIEVYYSQLRAQIGEANRVCKFSDPYPDLARTERHLISLRSRIRNRIGVFANALERAKDPDSPLSPPDQRPCRVFIGHGQNPTWRELRDFIEKRLGLPVLEFNHETSAGVPTADRLYELLSQARFALLLFTAEDRRADGTMHARENVIHEAGLFQGCLGFKRAIIVLEGGCEEFSNIHGLGQIRFPRNRLSAAYEEIRKVLEREGLLAH